jgi:hypothetical protein
VVSAATLRWDGAVLQLADALAVASSVGERENGDEGAGSSAASGSAAAKALPRFLSLDARQRRIANASNIVSAPDDDPGSGVRSDGQTVREWGRTVAQRAIALRGGTTTTTGVASVPKEYATRSSAALFDVGCFHAMKRAIRGGTK